jgi:hypothetical protein
MSDASNVVRKFHPNFKNMVGLRFDRLFVVEVSHRIRGHWFWLCRCDCGKTVTAEGRSLRSGHTRSCGCLAVDFARGINLTHGKSKTPEFCSWFKMKERCLNPNCPAYKNYGGRGIKIYPRWVNSFETFLAYVGKRPTLLHSLGRIKNDLGYMPGNVRWETEVEQQNNRSNNRVVVYKEKSYTVAMLARFVGIRYDLLRDRIRRGMCVDEAVSLPVLSPQDRQVRGVAARLRNKQSCLA